MRHEIDDTILRLAVAQHGVVARWQLARAGIPATLIDERVKRRRLQRVERCVYRIPALSGAHERNAAIVLSFGPDAMASHRTAADLHRMLPASGGPPTVSVSRGNPRVRPGVIMHRVRIDEDERTVCDGIPATSPSRTLLDLAAELSERPARDVAGAALAAGLVINAVTPTAIRLAPSLLVTDEEIDEALAVLEGCLSDGGLS